MRKSKLLLSILAALWGEEVKRVAFREAASDTGTASAFVEAMDTQTETPGSRYLIRVIESGVSKNNVFYTDSVLRQASRLLEGVRVFAKSDLEHLKGSGKDVRNIIGWLKNPRFVEGTAPNTGHIEAEFNLLQTAGDLASRIYEAYKRGKTDLYNFSIDAQGDVVVRGQVREARAISSFASVDLIVDAGAGGTLINLIESAPAAPAAPAPETANSADAVLREAREALQRAEMLAINAEMREAVSVSNLPDATKNKLRNQFANNTQFSISDVQAAIAVERSYLAKLTESGRVDMGGVSFVPGEQQVDKLQTMWDDFFNPEKPRLSLKECYIQTTADNEFTGRMPRNSPLREALDSTSFADVLGDSMNRRLLEEYRAQTNLDAWRTLTGTPTRLNDFRKRSATRFGGYGDLPIVAEGADYTALTSPTDEKAEYQGAKRGGLETITLEMIRDDDVGAVMRIPTKMNRSAKRTLSKFVFNFLMANPAIYDTVALFHATHGNLGTAALSAISLSAARKAVMKQAEEGSNEPIFIPPCHLWVPADLEETAFDLFRRQTNNDTDFVESLQMQIHPVWCFTDTDNWYASVNPADIPIIEIGFLDGREEPEMFVQDDPRTGSMFTNDKLTYKIRHIYGAAVVDYRGIFGSLVA